MSHPAKDCVTADPVDGKVLMVRFVRCGDRLGHRVSVVSGPQETVWLESEEGDDEDCWPPSPPLQQLLIESRASGDVALLVGMAGRSHWSLSVETRAAGVLRFDAACRFADPPGGLGSRYRVLPVNEGVEVTVESGVREATATSLRVRPADSAAGTGLARWTYDLRLRGLSRDES